MNAAGLAPLNKAASAGESLVRQERDFWMRRRGPEIAERDNERPQRPKGPRTDSGNPGTNGLLEPDGKIPGSAGLGGGRTRARTWDPLIKSHVLRFDFARLFSRLRVKPPLLHQLVTCVFPTARPPAYSYQPSPAFSAIRNPAALPMSYAPLNGVVPFRLPSPGNPRLFSLKSPPSAALLALGLKQGHGADPRDTERAAAAPHSRTTAL